MNHSLSLQAESLEGGTPPVTKPDGPGQTEILPGVTRAMKRSCCPAPAIPGLSRPPLSQEPSLFDLLPFLLLPLHLKLGHSYISLASMQEGEGQESRLGPAEGFPAEEGQDRLGPHPRRSLLPTPAAAGEGVPGEDGGGEGGEVRRGCPLPAPGRVGREPEEVAGVLGRAGGGGAVPDLFGEDGDVLVEGVGGADVPAGHAGLPGRAGRQLALLKDQS